MLFVFLIIQGKAVEEEILPEAPVAPAAAEWGSDNEDDHGNGWDAQVFESGQNSFKNFQKSARLLFANIVAGTLINFEP